MKADRRVLVACAALLVLGGCERAPVRTPANLAGEWVQLDVNGNPLPARREDRYQGRMCVTEVIRSVMALHADGTFTNTGESSRWCGMEGEPVVPRLEPFTITGTYTLHGPRGDTIRITTPGMEVSSRRPRSSA